MTRILFSFIIVALLVSGCQKKDDYLNGQTPDERLSEALVKYGNVLTGAPYGWKVMVYPQGLVSTYGINCAFSYYMKFNDTSFVTMYSDFDTTSAAVPKTSGFRLKALQRPSIEFDTYSYIHIPCDPDPAVSKSPIASEGGGYGWGSDFDFSFADNVSPEQLGDTIHLLGNFNKSTAYMVKATKAEMDAYNQGGLKKSMGIDKIQNYFKKVTLGSTVYEFTPGIDGKSLFIKWVDASGALQSTTSLPLYYTLNGINFLSPVTAGSQIIKSIDNISFDAGTTTTSLQINGVTGTAVGTIKSLVTDTTGAYRFWKYSSDMGSYYTSGMGFHVNGVDDYYGVTKVSGYAAMLFWANYTTTYDVFAGIVSGAINGPATYRPVAPYGTSTTASYFTTDGRIIFRYYGYFGTATVPFSTTVRTQITNASGYYLVQTGASSYDMVGAQDAKAWIRWSM